MQELTAKPATGQQQLEGASPDPTGVRPLPSGFRSFDILGQRHSEEEYQSLLRRLDLALGASNIGVWEHSLATDAVTWDPRMHRLYGTEPCATAVPVDIWMNALHPDDRAAAIADFEAASRRKGSYHSEFRIVLPDGKIRHIRSMANYFLDAHGDPGFIGAEWDVTADVELAQALAEQRRLAEERAAALQESRERIEHAADHDYLTGLPNRRLFDRICKQLDEAGQRKRLAVMHVDLDRFKEANDDFGHEAGDLVLKASAAAILSVLGPNDIAARMGGDEFVIVCVEPGNEADLRKRAHLLIERLGRGIEFLGKPVATGASLGVAIGDDRSVASLLKDADVALYSAKRRGRGRAVFYSDELHDRDTPQWHVPEFRDALVNGEIRPRYFCQNDSRTGELAGLEVAATWQHPRLGGICPEELLLELRERGLLPVFEQHMLQRVIDDLRYWQRQGYSLPRVTLRISSSGFASPRLLDEVRKADRLATRLCFEIMAWDSLKDMTAPILEAASGLRALGAQVMVSGIRDGDGSLIGLLRLRPERLKLDKTMLATAASELDQMRVLHAVSDFARAFEMTIIAEDTDYPDQDEILRNLGCTTLHCRRDQPALDTTEVPLARHDTHVRRLSQDRDTVTVPDGLDLISE